MVSRVCRSADVTTPLWRLDKMIAFPYHEEASKLRQRLSEASASGGSASRERAMMEHLVLHAQGPVAASERTSAGENEPTDLGIMLSMMSGAFGGGGGGTPADGRGGSRLLPTEVVRS